jgi:hypothetical protein
MLGLLERCMSSFYLATDFRLLADVTADDGADGILLHPCSHSKASRIPLP